MTINGNALYKMNTQYYYCAFYPTGGIRKNNNRPNLSALTHLKEVEDFYFP